MRTGTSPHRLAATIAATVVALDLGSKQLALLLLHDGFVSLPGGAFLRVVFNPSFVLGRTLGAHSLLAAAVVSAVVVALCAVVCGPLTAEDRRAPVIVGLVSGAAIANPGSLLLGTPGVVDFLGVPIGDGDLVFNLADIAAYLGVALMLPVCAGLAARVARERRPLPVSAIAERAPRPRPLEVEVPLPVLADGVATDAPRLEVPTDLPVRAPWLDLPPLADRPADAPRLREAPRGGA